jgi:hypothetical protein
MLYVPAAVVFATWMMPSLAPIVIPETLDENENVFAPVPRADTNA